MTDRNFVEKCVWGCDFCNKECPGNYSYCPWCSKKLNWLDTKGSENE